MQAPDLVRHQPTPPEPDIGGRPAGAAHVNSALRRGLRRIRPVAPDIAWALFVGLNLAAMRFLPAWQTVPFLAIWVSLTVIYGFRLWRLQPTIVTWAAVTLATGGIIGVQVLKGQQDADYLAEVPLIALMFLVMVWHGRRRLAAHQERLTAMEEVQRISQENLRLLEQQRQFLQDASHELGTPITVALGHAELIEQAAADTEVAADARVVTGELARLRRLTNRLLLLASAGSPGFLQVGPVATDSLVLDALERWGHVPRRWRLGEVAEATVLGDGDRLIVALDALLENAVAHTEPGDRIEVSVRLDDGRAVIGRDRLRLRHPADRPRSHFRPVRPRRAVPQPRGRRVRARPAHRAGHRRSPPRLGPGAQRQRPRRHVRAGHTRGPGRRPGERVVTT